MSTQPFANCDEDLRLQQRLKEKDPTAVQELIKRFYPYLVNSLKKSHSYIEPALDPENLYRQAAMTTILALAERPTIYDPSKGCMKDFLKMAARADLKNELQKARRRSHPSLEEEGVVREGPRGNIYGREGVLGVEEEVVSGEERETWRRHLEKVMEILSEEERGVLDVMLEGERKTEVYAQVLGLDHLPVDRQRREVYKIKDRIRKKVRRFFEREGDAWRT